MKLDSRHSLSLKLLRVVLLAALAVGVVLSCAQIVFDAYKAKQAVSSDAQRILAMVRDPSTQAVYSLDREMAMQVLEGLFQHEAVRQASIGHPGEPMLAEKSRPLLDLPTRWLTDPILGQERTFSIRLIGRPPYSEYYGDLKITLDTAPYGENFVTTSEIIFISGILRALAMGLVLFLVYHWMLTKPLSKIIEHLVSINPDRPSQHQLPLLKGHERNELGLWVTTANQLLASIESNSHLRREAEDNLLRISQYDFLTGLPNRQLLQQQLDQILDGAGRQQRRVAVLCLGLDDFKGINEQYTYQLGDQLLIALADRLRGHSARLGSLARLGGDQFALVQADIEQPYEAAELAQSILDGLEAPFEIDQHEVRLRATIGIMRESEKYQGGGRDKVGCTGTDRTIAGWGGENVLPLGKEKPGSFGRVKKAQLIGSALSPVLSNNAVDPVLGDAELPDQFVSIRAIVPLQYMQFQALARQLILDRENKRDAGPAPMQLEHQFL